MLADVTMLATELDVNIVDLEIAHSSEGQQGVLILLADLVTKHLALQTLADYAGTAQLQRSTVRTSALSTPIPKAVVATTTRSSPSARSLTSPSRSKSMSPKSRCVFIARSHA